MKLYMTESSGNAYKPRLLLEMLKVPYEKVMQWLALSNNELHYGLQWARGVVNKIKVGNIEEYRAYGNNGLKVLEGRLKGNDWLALGRPTIADLACYPYVKVSPEGGFKLEDYPAVQAWVQRVEALPGWVKRA